MLEKLLVLEVTKSVIRFEFSIHKLIDRNAVSRIARFVPGLGD